MATCRMSILRNFSHFPLVGPGWGIFSLNLSKLVLISPCLWRSRAFASFLRYLDIPALLSLGLGPLFFGPTTILSPPSMSNFLLCLNLYLHLAESGDRMVMSVSRAMVWTSNHQERPVTTDELLISVPPFTAHILPTNHILRGRRLARFRGDHFRPVDAPRFAVWLSVSIEISVLGLRLLAHAQKDFDDVMMSCSSQRTFKHEIRRTNDGFSLPYKGVQLSTVTNTIIRKDWNHIKVFFLVAIFKIF